LVFDKLPDDINNIFYNSNKLNFCPEDQLPQCFNIKQLFLWISCNWTSNFGE